MRNLRLVIEYDGAAYAGWQVQQDHPTIQGAVVEAIKSLTGEDVTLSGASRTDAGVHSYGQTANFLTSSNIPVHGVLMGLNSLLPGDIAVTEVTEVPEGFDSRRDSKGKVYLYRVLNRRVPSPLMRRYSWHMPYPLDINAMKEAARHMIGEKDFSSFRAADSDAPHSIREVTSVKITEGKNGIFEFEVRGTAFLRHMVRIMIGTLVTVGRGKLRADAVPAIIEAKDRTKAPLTAPPEGLFLVKVEY